MKDEGGFFDLRLEDLVQVMQQGFCRNNVPNHHKEIYEANTQERSLDGSSPKIRIRGSKSERLELRPYALGWGILDEKDIEEALKNQLEKRKIKRDVFEGGLRKIQHYLKTCPPIPTD